MHNRQGTDALRLYSKSLSKHKRDYKDRAEIRREPLLVYIITIQTVNLATTDLNSLNCYINELYSIVIFKLTQCFLP